MKWVLIFLVQLAIFVAGAFGIYYVAGSACADIAGWVMLGYGVVSLWCGAGVFMIR